MNPRPFRIALIAGETSGDQIGADLIAALKLRYPRAQFAGIGGHRMRRAGCDTWHDASELAVMGLVEVLRHLPRLLKLRAGVVKRLREWKPDVFIGIDAPDFNLGIERKLKATGIRTIHYVSPSIWAWRPGRAKKIGASADRVLCLFPMEPPIYARYGVDARFVGHPLAERFENRLTQADARGALELPLKGRVLAILPGSRIGEIERLGEIFVQAALQCANAISGLKLIAPMADSDCAKAFDAILAKHRLRGQIATFEGRAHEALWAADVVLTASGTAALEAGLAETPMVVAHRIHPLSYRFVRLFGLLNSKHVSLPNILLNGAVVPELLQDDCTVEKITDALLAMFRDEARIELIQTQLSTLLPLLAGGGSEAAADAVGELIERG
ncbi:MAG TPA: lipid-A-disaccharide synthase [Patescibacteria group bacterium]|nr:lipid-A-disaccharide synthase [Patescibacteria group bacterium]